MKLVKPSIQVREKQWDPRFYLGKLSDHEIKKQFVIKKKMVKRPSSTVKVDVEEKSITMRLYDLQLLWEQCNIPQFHRAYFLQYNDKDIEAILRETTEIKVKQAPAQRMMSLIKGREKCLHFLRNEGFEEHKFSELIFHLRILTINVVEQFRKWRDGLHRSVRWRIDDLDYLQKLKSDTDFLKVHYEQYQKDPYFLWIFKLATGDSVHTDYHQITKDLLRRIRECEILQLECEYYDMQTNILSRKEAQIIAKYMKEPSPKAETSPVKNTLTKNKIPKSVQISENLILKEYVVGDKKEFDRLLSSVTNDKDIESSFPARDDLFELIDYQDSYIIGFQQQTKLHGLCVCLSETNENTKKWIIEQIKLDDIQLFSKLIQNLTKKLNGTEITIKLVHYLQEDKLIDCEQLKQILKTEGFRWKQQTNDSMRNVRYTIYYKKQNYEQDQSNQFSFNFHIHRGNLSKLIEQTYSNIQENNHLAEKYKSYAESRKTDHYSHTLKLKPTIQDERINLLDLQLKLPQFKTEVRDGLKYYRIVQDREVSNITSFQIDGQTVYALATLQTDYWILISMEKLCEHVEIAQFQPTAEDLLIPMIQYTENILDTFNHLIRLQFDHLVLINKQQKDENCIIIKPEQFYFSIAFQGNILTNFKIQQPHFIKYKPVNSSIQISENIGIDTKKITLQEFRLNNLEPNPIKIKIQNYDCICALDNCSQSRRWIIYTITGCDGGQLKNVIELLITQLTIIDPNIQEVGLDFYHAYENGEFKVNKQLQQQLTSLGFKWKLQINEPHNQTRYTKFLLKLQRETQIVDNIVCQYFCTQESPDINVQPLIQQFSVFYQTLTQSQLIVKRNNLIPFSKYSNKDIPPEYDTDQMFETKINTTLTDCKYGTQDNQKFIIFNKSLISCTKHPELGLVYFVQLNNIIICLNQLEKEQTVDQITNFILKSTNDEKEEINEDVGLEFVQFNKTGSNYVVNLSLNARMHSAIKASNFKVIQKPYFIGIIEPGWFEKHNQMIASMIIL